MWHGGLVNVLITTADFSSVSMWLYTGTDYQSHSGSSKPHQETVGYHKSFEQMCALVKLKTPNHTLKNVTNEFKASVWHRTEPTATSAEVVTTTTSKTCLLSDCAMDSKSGGYWRKNNTTSLVHAFHSRLAPTAPHPNTIWHPWPTYIHWGRGVLLLREKQHLQIPTAHQTCLGFFWSSLAYCLLAFGHELFICVRISGAIWPSVNISD